MNEDLIKKLNTKDQALLATLWDDLDTRKALQHLIALKQEELAHFSAVAAPDFDIILVNRGMIDMGYQVMRGIRNAKRLENKRELAQQAENAKHQS